MTTLSKPHFNTQVNPEAKEFKGLSKAEVKANLLKFGPNILPEEKSEALWLKVFKQFKSPLIYILLFALAFDFAAWLFEGAQGFPLESLAIMLILLLNAGLGVRQEYRAEAALARLKDLAAPQVWVVRDDTLIKVPVIDLVPDDIVRLEAGDRIPADGLIQQAQGVLVDESMLTGEAVAVDKQIHEELFSGTLLTRGQGFMRVSRTGSQSAMGKLSQLLGSLSLEKTPLEHKIERFSNQIARWIIALALTLMVLGLYIEGLEQFSEVFLFAVALAVAAIPEGLPAVLTTTLALGTERMAKRKAVVRRLSAVEALGSITVIATDKTGTLTENQMRVHTLDAVNKQLALKTMVLACEADLNSGAGDPIELGLLRFVKENGFDPRGIKQNCLQQSTRPFDSEWKYMRVTTQENNALFSYFKGAPEVLLERSSLNPKEKQGWLEKMSAYGFEGYRALGLAYTQGEQETELEFLGLVLLQDPARAEVPDAIRRAQDAGIRVLMMTGDHPATAVSIAISVGIKATQVLVGRDLDNLSQEQLVEALEETNVLARVTPEHKLKIVEALKEKGEVVAVTGDGINDAPALKRAHVGVAMGQRGSDVSKEVADLILLDDNFATIVAAIEEGRSIYSNIQKFIRFLFATNLSEVILIILGVILAVSLGWREVDASLILPLTAVQILWINLVTDSLPALGLALDKNPNSMQERPRQPNTPLLEMPSLLFVILSASFLSLAALSLFWYIATQTSLIQARSVAFYSLVFGQLFYVFSSRNLAGRQRFNPFLITVFLITIGMQIAMNYFPPLQSLLELSQLSVRELGLSFGIAFIAGLFSLLLSFLINSFFKQKPPVF